MLFISLHKGSRMKLIIKYKKYIFLFILILASLIYMNSCKSKGNKLIDNKNSFINEDNQKNYLEQGKIEDSDSDDNIIQESVAKKNEAESNVDEKIYVYICGEIKNPGVYEISANLRLSYLVDMAGGFTDRANKTFNNLALKLEDEQRIYIPSLDEDINKLEISSDDDLHSTDSNQKIDLNKATIEDLQTLKGIGISKAKQIIDYRNQIGGFKNIEDIMKIKGIKESAFNKIKDYIYIK